MALESLIAAAQRQGASDLHLEPGLPVAIRVRGALRTLRTRPRVCSMACSRCSSAVGSSTVRNSATAFTKSGPLARTGALRYSDELATHSVPGVCPRARRAARTVAMENLNGDFSQANINGVVYDLRHDPAKPIKQWELEPEPESWIKPVIRGAAAALGIKPPKTDR